jgi:membrane-associated phospholipid phosphatase
MFLIQFDRAVCAFINHAARRWEWLDRANVVISESDLIKGGVVLAIFWAMWFRHQTARERLLAGLGGSLLALSIARLLAYVLPIRQRPLLEPDMHFVPPLGLADQSNWTDWSSFPSDHAALFFAIIAGIWLADRRAGIFGLIYVSIAICLPRLYVGIHYPSDVIAGGLIGVGAVALLSQWRTVWAWPLLRALDRYPGLGYALFFLLTFQIATLFWDVRVILSYFGFST